MVPGSIEIIIKPNGEVIVSVNGVKGEGCMQLTEFLEKALGELESRELKPEYYEKADVHQVLPLTTELD